MKKHKCQKHNIYLDEDFCCVKCEVEMEKSNKDLDKWEKEWAKKNDFYFTFDNINYKIENHPHLDYSRLLVRSFETTEVYFQHYLTIKQAISYLKNKAFL